MSRGFTQYEIRIEFRIARVPRLNVGTCVNSLRNLTDEYTHLYEFHFAIRNRLATTTPRTSRSKNGLLELRIT